jgi:DNA-binding GntR family transcriptional regulator
MHLLRPGAGTELADHATEEMSVHDWVYKTLRQMILYSHIEPGTWMRQKEVAAHFNVSRTPVREAFRTLSQEGLVELIPNYGARVSRLSIEEFEELYALRRGIEGLAARLTAQMVQPDDIPVLRASLDRLATLSHTVELPVYIQEEWQFRVQCYRLTGRQSLLEQVLFLREHAERYIRLAYEMEARVDESFAFHRRLLSAFEVRDGAWAERVLHEALNWTLASAGPVVAASVETSNDTPPDA